MNYNQYPSKGIDAKILLTQNVLSEHLGFQNVDFYGRALRVLSGDKRTYLPEVHISKSERKEVYYNDQKAKGGNVFFIEEDEKHLTNDGVVFEAKIKVVFMLNLDVLYPDATNRVDAEVQEKCIKLLNRIKTIEVTGIEKGLTNVLKGFNLDNILKNDMQPFHTFSINGILKYTFNCNH